MASSGINAWVKYYKDKPDQKTITNKETKAYDEKGKTLYNIPKGEMVTVLESKEYTSKLKCVDKNGDMIYVPMADLVKPGSKHSGATSLKPQAFNLVTSNPISIDAYLTLLKNSLDERTDLSSEVKSYLLLLTLYWSGDTSISTKLNEVFSANKASLPINDINKDFGEILGPIAIIKRNILKTKVVGGNSITNSTQIYVPARPNEPLLDYKIGDYSISAKSGNTTNTVKPSNILDLLEKDKKDKDKHIRTKQYQILKILQDNTALDGPPKALEYYLGSDKYKQWISNNLYLKGKKTYTQNELMYEAEKELARLSKSSLSFIDIFTDAIKNKIIYVKYGITSSKAAGDFEVITADDMNLKEQGRRPTFRTKNGYTIHSDKLGIQI